MTPAQEDCMSATALYLLKNLSSKVADNAEAWPDLMPHTTDQINTMKPCIASLTGHEQ